jgi:hypothetical protein
VDLSCRGLSYLDSDGEFHGCGECQNCRAEIKSCLSKFTELKKNVEHLKNYLSKSYAEHEEMHGWRNEHTHILVNSILGTIEDLEKFIELSR